MTSPIQTIIPITKLLLQKKLQHSDALNGHISKLSESEPSLKQQPKQKSALGHKESSPNLQKNIFPQLYGRILRKRRRSDLPSLWSQQLLSWNQPLRKS